MTIPECACVPYEDWRRRDGRFGGWTRGSDDGCVSPLVAMKIGRKVKRG